MYNIIRENINNQAYAHLKKIGENIEYESLIEHSERSFQVLCYFNEKTNLLDFLKKDTFHRLLLKSLFFTVTFHDYGKLNPYFQYEKMNNHEYIFDDFFHKKFNVLNQSEIEKISDTKTSNHSRFNLFSLKDNDLFFNFISDDLSVIINEYQTETFTPRQLKNFPKKLFNEIVYLFQFLTESHHDGIKAYFNKDKLNLISQKLNSDLLFIIELLHSILVNTDVISTKYFMECDVHKISILDYCSNIFKKNSNEHIQESISSIEYKQSYNLNIYKEMKQTFDFDESFKSIKDLNDLKNLLAKSVINDLKYINDDFLFIEGRVGIGKTNISFLIANELLKKDKTKSKIIYVAPLNNLLFQTKSELLNNTDFREEDISIINSLERDKIKGSNIEDSYYYENFNNNFILTSAVNFFEKLFHKGKKDIAHLIYLSNSIIFIDELQLLNDKFFDISYQYLNYLVKYLNCTVVVMSATIPVKKYTDSYILDNKRVYLVEKDKLDQINNHDLLNRNSYNTEFFYSVLNNDHQVPLQYLLNKKENNKILIVHNSIGKLNKFYNLVKNCIPKDYKVRFYNNNILKPMNEETIRMVKDPEQKIIVFATKKIETGVDVSFNHGIKFVDAMDNIEQFRGRINRYGNFINSEILIIADESIYFSDQKREEITRGYSVSKEIVDEFLGDINKYYAEIFEKEFETPYYINNIEDADICKLNDLQLIKEYKKDNFIIEISFIENPSFLEILSDECLTFIKKYSINSSLDFFDRNKDYFYSNNIKEYQSNFIISGFINLKTNFGKELSSLKEINISKSKKYKDFYKILNSDNFYYDLETGINFNKDIIEMEEILDTFNI